MIEDPHSGQKRRCKVLPLSPLSSNVFSAPCTDNAGFGTASTTRNAVPDAFWQFLQWQTPTNAGSASAE
jgi:hypothetical protein